MNLLIKICEVIETRLDAGGWVRRVYLFLATVMVWKFMLWAMHFAETSPRTGPDVAMIIAAIGAVVAPVTAFAFSNYLTSRTNENK
jgi:Mn2+/Fe2+ NRAMP family transporter